jgi:hypothetical protein
MEPRQNILPDPQDAQDSADADRDAGSAGATNDNSAEAQARPVDQSAVTPPTSSAVAIVPVRDVTRGPATVATPAGSPAPAAGVQASALHPEYYSVVTVSDDGLRLDYLRAPKSGMAPLSYDTLRQQIEEVSRLVRMLFQDDHRRLKKFIDQLHITADSGLCGEDCNTEIGTANLQEVKNRIADEFPTLRGKIWWSNLALLCGTAVICALASLILRYNTGAWYPALTDGPVWPKLALAMFLIPMGVMIGLFVEFVFRVSDDIPYEQLRTINPGRWKPFQRAFNTVLVAYIFAGILAADAVQVGVANILLNKFISDQPVMSLAIGFVTGFAYPFVRDLVRQFHPVKRDAPA